MSMTTTTTPAPVQKPPTGCCVSLTNKPLEDVTEQECTNADSSAVWTEGSCPTVTLSSGWLLFVLIWSVLGFVSFILSIVCWVRAPFGARPGTNILMFIVALLFGPIYLPVAFVISRNGPNSYCSASDTPSFGNSVDRLASQS
jgi:hypothetical protein